MVYVGISVLETANYIALATFVLALGLYVGQHDRFEFRLRLCWI